MSNDVRKGTVKIKEILHKGLFGKKTVYGTSLRGVPGIYGYSVNKSFTRDYKRGEEIPVNYWVFMGGKKDDYDEVMEFEIIEE